MPACWFLVVVYWGFKHSGAATNNFSVFLTPTDILFIVRVRQDCCKSNWLNGMCSGLIQWTLPEADPGFPRRETPTPEFGTKNVLSDKILAAWKWRDLDRKWGGGTSVPSAPLDPPMTTPLFLAMSLPKSFTFHPNWFNNNMHLGIYCKKNLGNGVTCNFLYSRDRYSFCL